jgi:hypothetical protein
MVQYDKNPKTPERIIELAQRAIALDDSNPVAYMALGEVYGLQRQYDRTIARDPNFPVLYSRYAAAGKIGE